MDLQAVVSIFRAQLARREIVGSFGVSKHTAEVLRLVVSKAKKGQSVAELIKNVRKVGKQLQVAAPLEVAISNIVRRVLFFIREDASAKASGLVNSTTSSSSNSATAAATTPLSSGADAFSSTGPLFRTASSSSSDGSGRHAPPVVQFSEDSASNGMSTGSLSLKRTASSFSLEDSMMIHKVEESEGDLSRFTAVEVKASVIEAINELIDELSDLQSDIAKHGPDFISNGDVVLTLGDSLSCEALLRGAAESKRDFSVICTSKVLAKNLASLKIATTLISPACIFPLMTRVHKVVVGAHAVMANGGVLANQGSHLAALAAKYHSVPFVVCTAMYKLCPDYPVDQDTFNELENPALTGPEFLGGASEDVQVYHPRCDYVPPNLVTLFVTNQDCISPSYIYRLLTEFYHQEDQYL
eukprot:ANDGO_00529.mRNA.1 Translation initiation factor eIF-2B subunit beta